MTSSTAELVEQARDAGATLHAQQAAFTELVRRTEHAVFALALARLRDVEDAKDVAQDAYATAWRRLRQLHDAEAFETWLKSVVVRECARRRRRHSPAEPAASLSSLPETGRLDYQRVVAEGLDRLPEEDRKIMVHFYFLGHTLAQIATLTALKPGTVAKRLHTARLRIRRELPRSVRPDFVPSMPTLDFTERVRRGLLDDYVGRYRFDRRPDHVISIVREEGKLISEGADQRHLIAWGGDDALLACHYDGEARFKRDRSGRVSSFVYYEFGKRMGIARRIEIQE
jgi:RNA polymerase sigma-70 factor, ECF subfamily